MNINALKEQGRALVAQQKALMADDRPWSVKAADFNKLDGDIKAVLEQVDAY